MNKDTVKPFSKPGYFTAFVFDHGINMLVRSADWYKLPPIQRYLYNMAADEIRMEDAKTESRTYSFERFDQMRLLIERCDGHEWDVAFEACMTFGQDDHHFGVVHLDLQDGKRGDLLLGDDPADYAEWCPNDVVMATFEPASAPESGLGGRDV